MLIHLGQKLNQNKEKVREIKIIRIGECATTSPHPSPLKLALTHLFLETPLCLPLALSEQPDLVLIEKYSSKLGISKLFL